ncbi:MAG TPA: efflux RND transporter permease subunit [Phenylobacterium sp.]|jgi:multidrug efflux pump subunit AcrB|nr:efflux RND transporter permease subunit [Phenylobacterium sp.]
MWLVRAALRRPIMMLVMVLALALASILAISRSKIDIFPDLDSPVIYVAQPYGGMSPQQMEGYISYYYEYHFLYINGIETVEAKSIQGASLLRLNFHPGTNMSQALAETISYVNRARAFMPPGTVSPFVVRYDAGTLPVGYLVFTSPSKTLGEIQDAALNKVRPQFATLPGVSSPPPFGGNQRSILVNVDPNKLRGYGLSADDVLQALVNGNSIEPAGIANIGSLQTLVTTDSTVTNTGSLLDIPLRDGANAAVYLRDVASVTDGADIPAGYALINGKRTVYIPVTKRPDASTIAVVKEVRQNLPRFQALLPDDISVSYQYDQSRYVTDALWSVVREAVLGALLVGAMLLLFLRDWRSSLIVVVVIPFALLSAVVALWAAGQTINIMTLGGLALAVGVLVDDGTVLLENIHVHMARGAPVGRAVVDASGEVAIPRLVAMSCILAVFIPSFFMVGAARALFVPLSLAVGFSIGAAYLLFSTLIPILSVWFLRSHAPGQDGHKTEAEAEAGSRFGRFRTRFLALQDRLAQRRAWVLAAYAIAAPVLLILVTLIIRTEIFPSAAANQIRLRMDAPEGARIAVTEAMAQQVLRTVSQEAGPGVVDISLSYVGLQGSSYPINLVFLWTGGPHEAVMNISLKPGSGVSVRALTKKLRKVLPGKFPGTQFSFEPGDLVSQILNFGTSSIIDIAVTGPTYGDVEQFAGKLKTELSGAAGIADLKFGQSLHYPNIDVRINRIVAGQLGATADKVGRAVVAATASTRFVTPNYWRDPKSGISYQVQVQVPQAAMTSLPAVAAIPVAGPPGGADLLLGQVADIRQQTVPGELDRRNGQWLVSVTANLTGPDLGRAAKAVDAAIARAGTPPKGVSVDVRGQISVMRQIFSNLSIGLGLSILVMLLLLTANFQSLRLSLIALSTVPAVLLGSMLFLFLTATSLNLESFMGMIMVIGVALANAILLVTFAERNRRAGQSSFEAARNAASERLRPVLMTSLAMIAGMAPMALAIGAGAEETAPLGRAVIGGLLAATAATLFLLPSVFGLVQRKAALGSVSLDPDDPASRTALALDNAK